MCMSDETRLYTEYACIPLKFLCIDDVVLDGVQTSKRALSLEACTFDETVARMGQFADLDSVTLTVQRLLPRKSVVTVIVGPQGETVGNFTVLHHVVHSLLCVQCIHVIAKLRIIVTSFVRFLRDME